MPRLGRDYARRARSSSRSVSRRDHGWATSGAGTVGRPAPPAVDRSGGCSIVFRYGRPYRRQAWAPVFAGGPRLAPIAGRAHRSTRLPPVGQRAGRVVGGHVMSTGSSGRRLPRYQIVLPVSYDATPKGALARREGSGWTRNLSETGACLELTDALPAGTTLRLAVQDEGGAVSLEAHVIWVGHPRVPAGGTLHGVTFGDLALHERLVLPTLCRRHAGLRVQTTRIPAAFPVGVPSPRGRRCPTPWLDRRPRPGGVSAACCRSSSPWGRWPQSRSPRRGATSPPRRRWCGSSRPYRP